MTASGRRVNQPLMDKVAVVIPCYKCKAQIGRVLESIPAVVGRIYVVDDKCPEQTGRFVEEICRDPRLRVIYHDVNKGVGGAVVSGYRAAIEEELQIAVKIDGDGQMNPELLPKFIEPIADRTADYTKGNRFFNVEDVRGMPLIRIFGNAVLSFMTKISSGYWGVFDPTNGYTAVYVPLLNELSLDKIDQRYFFESDMLFRLHLAQAVVVDIPMKSHYADEKSNLSVLHTIPSFIRRHTRNALKRIFYEYFLRNFSAASLELVAGTILFFGGILFGLISWHRYSESGAFTPTGTIALALFPAFVGFQLLLSFLNADVASTPLRPRSSNDSEKL